MRGRGQGRRRCSATPRSTAQVPGGQAEYLRVPQAQYGPHQGAGRLGPDEQFLSTSPTSCPTAWQGGAVYADVTEGGTVAVVGPRPGRRQFAGAHRPAPEAPSGSSAWTWCPERLALARQARGIETLDIDRAATWVTTWRCRHRADRDGRTAADADSVIEAVGMEAHGNAPGLVRPDARPGLLPDAISAQKVTDHLAIDRLDALISVGRSRSGAAGLGVAVLGVYGGDRQTRCR